MDILRKAARPEQEPVAWLSPTANPPLIFQQYPHALFNLGVKIEPLYTHPPQRKPLTDDEIELAYREIWRDLSDGFSHTSVEWIEAGIRYAEKVHGIE